MPGKPWTDAETQYIRDHYLSQTCAEMANGLPGRTARSVGHRSAFLKLERPKPKMGDKFGRLRVDRLYEERTKWQMRTMADATCECGTQKFGLPLTVLVSGATVSCGCLKREKAGERIAAMSRTHGETNTRLYRIWAGVKTRATNPNATGADNYVNRGIGICEEWMKYEPFRDWATANGYSDDLQIDRRENDLGYSPSNCRWVTRADQTINKRTTRRLTAFGETKSLKEWADDPRCSSGSYRVVQDRLDKLGWDLEKAILTPAGPQGPKQ